MISLHDSPRGITHSVKIFDFTPWGRRIANARERENTINQKSNEKENIC